LYASSLLSFSDEARLFIAASPPVEVTATRSSLLDFVLRFLFHRMHIIYTSQISRHNSACLDVHHSSYFSRSIIPLSTSGEPLSRFAACCQYLQPIFCNVPSRRACFHSFTASHPPLCCRSIAFKFHSCSLRNIRPTFAPPSLIATFLHPETYPEAR
jgi:hypothetical protein